MRPVYDCLQSRTDNINLYTKSIFTEMHEGIRPGGLSLTEHLIKLCGFNKGDMIADVGCGTGISLEYIRRKYFLEAAGVDSSDVLIQAGLKKFPSLRLIHCDGKSLPFRDGSVDGVLAECSLSVMDDPRAVLGEIRRVLADYGKLAISDVYLRQPEFAEVIRNLPLKGCISGAFLYNDIISMLNDSGFSLVLWEDHSDLWKQFIAGIILNNGSLCEIFSTCSLDTDRSIFLEPAVLRSKPGYFCLIAEKNH